MVTKIILELSNLFSHEILILVEFMKKKKIKEDIAGLYHDLDDSKQLCTY